MAITKKILIIEFVIAFILSLYFWTSLLLLFLHISINVQTFEARLWFLNTLSTVVLCSLFIIIHLIIRSYSLRQVVENLKFRKLKEVELFKLFISIGTFLLIVPNVILAYVVCFIPYEQVNSSNPFFILTNIFVNIGFVICIVGVCLHVRSPNITSESKIVPTTKDLTNRKSILSEKKMKKST